MSDGDAIAGKERQRLGALARFASRRGANKPYSPWPDGQLPGRLFVATDGLWTHSSTDPDLMASTYRPWLEVLTTQSDASHPFQGLRDIDPAAVVRGFSYRHTGFHYHSAHTTNNIDDLATRFARDYTPLPCLPTIYLAFSLGAVVTTLGLAEGLTARDPSQPSGIEAVILVQPAFRGSKMLEEVLPASMAWLIRRREDSTSLSGYVLIDRALDALVELRQTWNIPIHLLYWPRDQFIPYDDPLPEGRPPVPALLSDAGVSGGPLATPLTFAADRDAFQQHSDVASHPVMLAALQDLLRILLPPPATPQHPSAPTEPQATPE